MTLNADPRDYDFEPWDDAYDEDRLSLIDRLSGNTGMIAGVLTVIVTFSIVSANALYYQPHEHQGAMFNTRENTAPAIVTADKNTTRQSFERDVAALPSIASQPANKPSKPVENIAAKKPVTIDPQKVRVRMVQSVLQDLAIYQGKVDGLSGPQTRGAVMKYQKILGLAETGKIDANLMAHLTGDASAPTRVVTVESQADKEITVASIKPTPRPKPQTTARDSVAELIQSGNSSAVIADKATVKQLQAGLRQFDNPDIVVDGVQGSKTTAALKLFQETFHLDVTGRPNQAVFQKMRDLGYIN